MVERKADGQRDGLTVNGHEADEGQQSQQSHSEEGEVGE